MNKESEKILLLVGVGVLGATIAYAATAKIRNNNEQANVLAIIADAGTTGSVGQNLLQVDPSTLPEGTFPLVYASLGKNVVNLQTALNRDYNGNLPITGVMDDATMLFLCKHYYNFLKCTTYTESTAQIDENTIDINDYNNILNNVNT